MLRKERASWCRGQGQGFMSSDGGQDKIQEILEALETRPIPAVILKARYS